MSRALPMSVDAQLRELRDQFERWRSSQSTRTRLPEDLWRAATGIARAAGIHPVAKALRLDYYQLKRRVAATPPKAARPTSHPGFIELSPGAPAPAPVVFAVQMERPDGTRFQVQLSNEEQLLRFAESFWGRRG